MSPSEDYTSYEYGGKLEKKPPSGLMGAFENPIIPRTRIPDDRRLELKKMPYKEYLRTQEWQAIRRYMRSVYTSCALCGHGGKDLQVHHNSYTARGSETPIDLVVLCEDCHSKTHFGRGVLLSDDADEILNILAENNDIDMTIVNSFHLMYLGMKAVSEEVSLRRKMLNKRKAL